ncbi:MAG: tetratricopeptide repeat protein [Candidatus Odinarchaeota archaeon]
MTLNRSDNGNHSIQLFLNAVFSDRTRATSSWFYKGHFLAKLHSYEEAKKAFEMALQCTTKESEQFVILHNLGDILLDLDKNEEVLETYQKTLDTNPGSTETKIMIMESYIKIKEYEAALDLCNILLSENPYNENYWRTKGRILEALEEYDEAILAYYCIYLIDHREYKALFYISNCYASLNNFELFQYFVKYALKEKKRMKYHYFV